MIFNRGGPLVFPNIRDNLCRNIRIGLLLSAEVFLCFPLTPSPGEMYDEK